MKKPDIRVIGIYRVPVTDSLFKEAMDAKYGDLKLNKSDLRQAEAQVREELNSVVLIEALVICPDDNFSIEDFGQLGSDQAPYQEAFLNEEGTELLSGVNQHGEGRLRIVFFLHFYDPDRALNTSYGEVICPAVSKMPERLSLLISYEPVD